VELGWPRAVPQGTSGGRGAVYTWMPVTRQIAVRTVGQRPWGTSRARNAREIGSAYTVSDHGACCQRPVAVDRAMGAPARSGMRSITPL
jgi:hypothetical protein